VTGAARLPLLVAVAVGGAVGCLARYGIGLALPTPPTGWPTGTFLANLAGALLLGLLLEGLARTGPDTGWRQLARLGLGTGLLGAFTTYSTLAVELDLQLARVDGDAEQLKQVLINLVQNAVQAIGAAAGRITVSSVKPDRFGDFRGGTLTDYVEVHVSDTGPGIPADQQQHIFVPFFTTKQKGTGLGLAICQRIVKNHGGSISVLSKPGEGCTFVIRLPCLPSEQPSVEWPGTEGTPFPSTRPSLPASTAEESRETPPPKAPEPKPKRERKRKAG